jgi:TolA-binding protein
MMKPTAALVSAAFAIVAAGAAAAQAGQSPAPSPAPIPSVAPFHFEFAFPDIGPFPDFNLSPDVQDRIDEAMSRARERGADVAAKAQEKAQEAIEKAQEKLEEKFPGPSFAFQDGKPAGSGAGRGAGRGAGAGSVPPMPPTPPVAFGGADALYDQARSLIDRERYDDALRRLNDLIDRFQNRDKPLENRVDAAFYWKAYTLGKEQQFSDALTTLADMQKRFADSRWVKDAKALELELRQSSGQAVSPDGQSNDELKLLALRGVMRSDPDRAVPMIEQLLAGNSSVNVKENALFLLSQSQAPKAREIITNAARSSTNPDLQLRAVRYLGVMRTPEAAQTLSDIYKNTNDSAVKRAIMQSLIASGNTDRVIDIARNEKDPEMRRTAIRTLGSMNAAKSGDALRSMYASETSPESKKDIVNALYAQRNAALLVDLARAEKDPAMKKEIVSRLSTMRVKEATDYMLELLK